MPEADPEERPAVVDHRPSQRDRAVEPRRIARAGRQDHAVDVGSQRDCGRDRVRQDPDARAAAAHPPNDVRLQAVVDDPDQRPTLLARPDVDDRRRRDLADEVLVLPAADASRPIDGRVAIREARLGHDAAQAAVRSQVARQGARVHPGDRGDVVAAKERGELAGVVEHGRRRVRDDERAEPRPKGLIVVDEPAVVADERVRHDHDLAGVRRVGADLLVARLRGVDDQVAARGRRCAERDPGKDRAVLEGQQRGHRRDGGREPRRPPGGRRSMTSEVAAGRRVSPRSLGPHTKTPPARRARWTRGHTIRWPPFRPHRTGPPASRDRLSRMAEG